MAQRMTDTMWKNRDSGISEQENYSEEWILKYEDGLGIPSPIYFTYIFIFMRTEE